METSKPEKQKEPLKSESNGDNSSKKQNDFSNDELRVVEEKGMVGQPMGNKIQNTSFKNMTPAEKDEKQKPDENYSKSVKEKQS
jgi:hypothetical protein